MLKAAIIAPSSRDHVAMWIWGVAVVAVLGAWGLDRRRRRYADLPPTPAAAVFAGRNEVVGRAWAEEPLSSRRVNAPCISWKYVLEEERTHTRVVSSTDSNGRTSTRTETYRQWHVIDTESGSLPEFEMVDPTGSVIVRLTGAKVETRRIHRDTFRREKEGGFFAKMFDNATGRYRETEDAIVVGDTLFVVGEARLDQTRLVPVLSDDVLVSSRTEASRILWLSAGTAVSVLAAVALVAASIAVAVSPRDPTDPIAWVPGVCVALVGLAVAWVVTVYNRLRLVGQGVDRAHSLVDVQLRRRHDLIPAFADVVRAHVGHESTVLARIAEVRSTAASSSVAEQTAVLHEIVAVSEEVPTLAADESFAALAHQLADTEGRIAASRTFYNDSLNLLHDRRRHFPSSLVARWIPQSTHELFAADGFERTVPPIRRAFEGRSA
jgi:hypothetical protein